MPENAPIQTSMIQIVKSNQSQEKMWYSAWYVQLASLFITPLYALIQVLELIQTIKEAYAMVLGVLIDVFVFTFLFGWFWNTRLFSYFKRLRIVRASIKMKLHYHMLNIASGALQAYFIRLLLPFPPKYGLLINIICGVLGLITVIVSITMPRFHCYLILLLPTLLSRHGRRVIMIVLFTSIISGPISNIKGNSKLVTNQMNCIAGKARNTSDLIVDNVKERYENLHHHILSVKNKTEEKVQQIHSQLTEVKEKVYKKYSFLLSVVSTINDFVEKCESTMGDLNGKCQKAFKSDCRGKRYAEFPDTSPENLSYTIPRESEPIFIPTEVPIVVNVANSTSDSLKPEAGNATRSSKPVVRHHTYYGNNKKRYAEHPPRDTIHTGKIIHYRSKRGLFGKIYCFFKNLVGSIIRPICDIIFNSLTYLCRTPKLLTHFITGIVLKKFGYLEQSLKNNLWIEVKSNLTFEKEIVEVRSAHDALRELEDRLVDRYDVSTPFWLSAGDYLKILTMILVYVNTYFYLQKYWKSTAFDNIYMDRSLVKYDCLDQGKSVFPLHKKDLKKYVQITQRKLLPQESFMFSRSSLKALVYVIIVAAVEGADKILVLLLKLMYEYGPVSAEHTIDFQDLNDIEFASSNSSKIHLVFDTRECFHLPTSLPLRLTGHHFLLVGCLLALALIQPYVLRYRHIICDSFHPTLRTRRVSYLHEKIRKSREYTKKHAAETVFAKIAEKNKISRLFPFLHKNRCILCRGKEFLQKCQDCDTTYCVMCLRDVGGKCKVCQEAIFQRRSSQMLLENSNLSME